MSDLLTELERGVPVSFICKFLGTSKSELTKLLKDSEVEPMEVRNGFQMYDFKRVLSVAFKPEISLDDVTEILKKMKPKDLPVELQKEYWQAQISRQKYEENAKDLWRTSAVMDVFAATFKTLRQEILLFSDTIEAQTGLTNPQREVLFALSDALLNNLHEALVRNFGGDDLLSGFE